MPFSGCRVALIIYRMLCVSLFLHLCSSCFVSYVLILAPHYFQNACLCSHGSCEDEPWCSHMMCRLIANRCWLIIYWMLLEFWLIADWLLAACFINHCSASVDWLLIDSLLINWLLTECCLSAVWLLTFFAVFFSRSSASRNGFWVVCGITLQCVPPFWRLCNIDYRFVHETHAWVGDQIIAQCVSLVPFRMPSAYMLTVASGRAPHVFAHLFNTLVDKMWAGLTLIYMQTMLSTMLNIVVL